MGGVTLDQHLWGTLTRVSPEASRPHRCQPTHGLFVIDIVIEPGRLGSPVLVDAKGSKY
jgi:hypothetical protein